MSHHHCHGHHHHHHCCDEQECSCCHHHDEDSCGKEDFADQLLQLADEAWMEVLKEKIKAHVTKSNGAQLEKLAKVVAEANKDRWRLKLASKKGCEDFHCKIADFFKHE